MIHSPKNKNSSGLFWFCMTVKFRILDEIKKSIYYTPEFIINCIIIRSFSNNTKGLSILETIINFKYKLLIIQVENSNFVVSVSFFARQRTLNLKQCANILSQAVNLYVTKHSFIFSNFSTINWYNMKIASMFTHFLSYFEKQNWTDLHYLYVSNHFGENERQNPMMSQ